MYCAGDEVNVDSCTKSSQISIGISTTQLLHNLSTALNVELGDELILSKVNHEANISPWVRIAKRLGLTIKWWSATDVKNPVCDLEELKSLLSEKTRLVTCPHVSNITGTITNVKEVAAAVHQFPRVCKTNLDYFHPECRALTALILTGTTLR